MKKLTMLLALLLCVMTTSAALATKKVEVVTQDLATKTQIWYASRVDMMEGTGEDWWGSTVPTEDRIYRFGAAALNQSFLNEYKDNANVYRRAYCVYNRHDANFTGYRVWFKYDDFGIKPGDTLMAYYGNYNPTYTHHVTSVPEYTHWEPMKLDVQKPTATSVHGDFYLDIDEEEYLFPILLLWKSEGNNGGNPGGNYQPPQMNNVGQPAKKVPQTGDPFELALWICLMGLAGVGMLILRRRVHS